MTIATLDPERQIQAKQYARIRRRLWLVDTLFTGLYTVVWLTLGWSAALRDWLEGFISSPWLLVLGFVAVFGGILYVLTLPLGYYTGFVLPHRFGQSNQTFRDWLIDQLKSLLIGVPLGLLMVEGLYVLLHAAPDTWWLWAAGALLLFSVLMVNLSPVLIMPLFNKFVPLGEEHADLARRLMDLAVRAKTKVRGVYKFDMSRRTRAANAALTGIGNTRRIVLGDTLISEFTADEVETVLAHELAHHVHRDMLVLISSQTVLTLGGLYLASLAMEWGVGLLRLNGTADVAALPLFLLVIGAYGLVTGPLGNAIVRWRERMADRYALDMTGKAAAFESAFIRLANQNLGEVDPEKWVVFMFYDHPPLGERIAMARAARTGR